MSEEIEILDAPAVHNRGYWVTGLALLAANSLRHRLRGYRTPRPQPLKDPDSAYTYARSVVDNWLGHASRYLRRPVTLEQKRALELGPGPDLGTGLVLLGKGLQSYFAVDVHPLLPRHPEALHRGIVERVAGDDGRDPQPLLSALEDFEAGRPGRLRYRHDPHLKLEEPEAGSMDLLLSHAVFEHLGDVEGAVEGLSRLARPGALLVAEIDLQTHTRWIRDADPLNIYRYRSALYRSFSFSGIPNRVRPDDYKDILLRHGWTDVRFFPRRVLPPEYVRRVEPTLAPSFRGDIEHLGWLSIVLCATFGGEEE